LGGEAAEQLRGANDAPVGQLSRSGELISKMKSID
jgi:hypothetical protein